MQATHILFSTFRIQRKEMQLPLILQALSGAVSASRQRQDLAGTHFFSLPWFKSSVLVEPGVGGAWGDVGS